jgi:Xaa-Pro aminopeptidase
MSSKNCFLIENPLDLFYLTGLKLSSGQLFVAPEESALFVDGRYIEMAQSRAKGMEVELISLEQQNRFLRRHHIETIFFDSAKTTCDRLSQLQKNLSVSFEPRPGLVKKLRAIKKPSEIKKLKQSAALAYAGYKHLLHKLKVGVTEHQLATEFKLFCLKEGADEAAFEPIVAFGKNAALPHHQSGKSSLKKGDIVLLDLGAKLEGYISDMTRVHFFGRPDPKLYELYTIVRNAQMAALEHCRPKTKIGDLDTAARQIMSEAQVEHLFPHSLGHGVGLEVHEYPLISHKGPDATELLAAGMAITIEPGLYLPGTGGIRYEDTILITEQGYRNLYPSEENPCSL